MEFIMYGKIYDVNINVEPGAAKPIILVSQNNEGHSYSRSGATLSEALTN